MGLKSRAKKVAPKPSAPYVEIQRVESNRYELTLKDPGDWLAHDFKTARSLRRAEAKAEFMLHEHARLKGYQQESWTVTLAES